MTWLQMLVLALVQGITEFLPVSSSAHLILASQVAGWPDQGLAFDVAVHLGTLVAVVIYFRSELYSMLTGVLGGDVAGRRLAIWLALASLPVAIVGLAAAGWIESVTRDPLIIAWATIVFALVLAAAWLLRSGTDSEQQVGWRRALAIGIAQVLALLPGTSRAGITMSAGLMLGLSATASARFSFLLAIPAIAMAASYGAWQVALGEAVIDWATFATAAVIAGLAALLCIHVFLRLLNRVGMLPFVAYRLVLGGALLLWLG